MNRSPLATTYMKYDMASPNRHPFYNSGNRQVMQSPERSGWSGEVTCNKAPEQHEQEHRKTSPQKAITTPLWKRNYSPFFSSPSTRASDEWSSSKSVDETSCVSFSSSQMEIVHARLDSSLSCSLCEASHALYLMYPVIKTLDTWNESSRFLCSVCFADKNNRQDVESSLAPDTGTGTGTGTDTDADSTVPKPRVMAKRPAYRKTTTSLISQSSCQVQSCLDLLHIIEDELDEATSALSDDSCQTLEASIRRELTCDGCVDEGVVQEELDLIKILWQTHYDLLTDTATVLQAALDQDGYEGCDLLLAYYQWRMGNSLRVPSSPAWKTRADHVLCQRDILAGVGPGHFWGASRSTEQSLRKLVVESATREDFKTTDPSGIKKTKSHEHIIEELATLQESQVYQLILPARRGLGWNTSQSHDPGEEAKAYETESAALCISRTEHQDRILSEKEHSGGTRTLLVLVEEEEHDDSNDKELCLCLSQPATPNQKCIPPKAAKSIESSPSPSPEQLLKRTLLESSQSSTESLFVPTKRAKRRCLRCVKFQGQSPTRCRGSKGRWGQKGCEYFTVHGKKVK